MEPPTISSIMVRRRRYHLSFVFNWVAGDLRFGGFGCDFRPSFDGGRFSRGDSGHRRHLDICVGFVDFFWEAEEIAGGRREEIDGGDYSDGG